MKDWHCLTAEISLGNWEEMESEGSSCLISTLTGSCLPLQPVQLQVLLAATLYLRGFLHSEKMDIIMSQDRWGGQTQLWARQLGN